MVIFFVLNILVAFGLFISFIYISIISYKEKEYRASVISFISGIIAPLPFILVALLNAPLILQYGLLIILGLISIILFLPFNPKFNKENPQDIHDERDTIFSRSELIEGSEKYKRYYEKQADKKQDDDYARSKPGLLSEASQYYNPLTFSVAQTNFDIIGHINTIKQKTVSEKKIDINTSQATSFVKNWLTKLGATSVGITELRNHHLYSHKGRGVDYDKEIENKHKFAIAFTTEMDIELMQTAPNSPVVMESSQQYLTCGLMAHQLSNVISNLGYEAKAHTDGNYEVVCPLVARDAGLGEVGRMGLLMTPKLGPRVRIAVVTTDLPLNIDKKQNYHYMIDFCNICKKCAVTCPSQSISYNKRKLVNNTKRWQINQEKCFTYWNTIGTDCGKCMASCPFSHENNLMHNFIRWGIKNSYIFRRFAIVMDDIFYGKNPKKKHIPKWLKAGKQ
ncbi:MAG: reductive dehalogenase domain-containing protein, partial [Bacteroidota bacterium]|nr:reductive dehalogenase domain-containing protein [Bacteroidota bacterium]